MVTVSEVVQRLVARSPFISEALSEGLINISALARRLQPQVEAQLGKQVREGAIVMAVKRMQFGELLYIEKDLRAFFRRLSDISVRSNLLDFTFANSETLLRCQARLLDAVGQRPKGFYTFSQGIGETTIVIHEGVEDVLLELFSQERLLNREDELSAVTLVLPEENRSLYGVYYYILKELAWIGINLVEIISTSNEFTLIFNDADLDEAFSALIRLRDAGNRQRN